MVTLVALLLTNQCTNCLLYAAEVNFVFPHLLYLWKFNKCNFTLSWAKLFQCTDPKKGCGQTNENWFGLTEGPSRLYCCVSLSLLFAWTQSMSISIKISSTLHLGWKVQTSELATLLLLGIQVPDPAAGRQVSSIKYQVPSIKYQVSSVNHWILNIKYPVSSIQYGISSIKYEVSSIQY